MPPLLLRKLIILATRYETAKDQSQSSVIVLRSGDLMQKTRSSHDSIYFFRLKQKIFKKNPTNFSGTHVLISAKDALSMTKELKKTIKSKLTTIEQLSRFVTVFFSFFFVFFFLFLFFCRKFTFQWHTLQ